MLLSSVSIIGIDQVNASCGIVFYLFCFSCVYAVDFEQVTVSCWILFCLFYFSSVSVVDLKQVIVSCWILFYLFYFSTVSMVDIRQVKFFCWILFYLNLHCVFVVRTIKGDQTKSAVVTMHPMVTLSGTVCCIAIVNHQRFKRLIQNEVCLESL